MTEKEILEQVATMRSLTRRTGAICDAQLLQIKVWPRLLFGCVEHGIDYDNSTRDLYLEMTLKKVPASKQSHKKALVLEEWCHTVLGPEWAIHLNYKVGKTAKKVLLKGRRLQEIAPSKAPAMEYELHRYRGPRSPSVAIDTLPDIDLESLGLESVR